MADGSARRPSGVRAEPARPRSRPRRPPAAGQGAVLAVRGPTLEAVAALHREVDRAAARVADALGARLRCRRGCAGCCRDDLTVFAVEAAWIADGYPELLREGEPHGPGACAMLDEDGACRIYPRRPYVCRTQGLPLRYTRPGREPGVVEEVRDICPLNEPGEPPLLELPEDRCWLLGPFEARLAALQERETPGRPRRVRLRDLFGMAPGGAPPPGGARPASGSGSMGGLPGPDSRSQEAPCESES